MNEQGPHVGLIGLAVMGENLGLNIARNGFPLVVYNRTTVRTEEYLAGAAAGTGITGVATMPDLVAALARPRQIILLVKAGVPVDAVLTELAPLLDPGDIVVDGGNSYFRDTERREAALAAQNLMFVGMGVSGGEVGALEGPSLMPGGPREAYDVLEPMLTAIAAKGPYGPCVSYIGPGGSGHYVKMIHNGIEYGDMQLIAEAYDVMRSALGMPADKIASVFADWNTGKLASFLIEVAADVLRYIDTETGRPLVDLILDAAEQKGTGRWTIESALELASPVPTIDAAVTARNLSALRGLRLQASEVLVGPSPPGGPQQAAALLGGPGGPDQALTALEDALYFSKVSSYAQGMALLSAASAAYSWTLDLSEIARIWTGGCIIRAAFLADIMRVYRDTPGLANMLLDLQIAHQSDETVGGVRRVIVAARSWGIPVPGASSALDYFDTLRQPALPANLIQAQRDYFGAHTYQRIDREGVFHTLWHGDEQPVEPVPLQVVTDDSAEPVPVESLPDPSTSARP
ncbi:MAG TPA: NADP-dependent phosphogluconate dehydrogenase [Thermomicrobiales bacterium]|nr:NADP-dependent phosphogluconate dehydrogenase [Thermomicrobiales bacterium]